MAKYLLPNHVYFCTTPQASIFLDVRNDRYTGLQPEQARALPLVIHGWPGDPSNIDQRLATQTAEELLERGLLTRDPATGRIAAQVMVSPATEAVWEWPDVKVPHIRLADVLCVALCHVRAAGMLRIFRFETVVSHVARRKALAGASTERDASKLRHLTAAFLSVRPLLYTSRDRCLLDSLVLVEFLAMHRLFPTWVIGVQPAPFAAHSWVQAGQCVLNNPVRYVRKFTPILTI
jgi:hypothetical protein